MNTNKFWKHGGTETRRYLLVLTLALFVSMMIAPEFNQALAGNTILNDGEVNYDDNTYTMKAKGQDYHSYGRLGGDWKVENLGGYGIRLQDVWMQYHFEVPHYMYDNKLIEKFTVKVQYDNVDYGDNGGKENLAPTLACYNLRDNKWDYWKNFSVTGDGSYKWVEFTTDDLYPDEPNYHIEDSGGEKYRIKLEIQAPDGKGTRNDDDAEIDIDDVYVILQFKEHKPGKVITGGTSEGEKTEAKYTMTAKGKEIWAIMPGEKAEATGNAFEIVEGWVKYAFKVPEDVYDYRLIEKINIKVTYDDADSAASGGDSDKYPVELSAYRYKQKGYSILKKLPDTNRNKTVKGETYNIYPSDQYQYVGSEGNDEYHIYVKIYAPGGDGSNNDDDANLNIKTVQVILLLNHHNPPVLTHISPDKGSNSKVNVPKEGDEPVTFTVEADAGVDSQFGIETYNWKTQVVSDPAPSLDDSFDEKTTDPKADIDFKNSGEYEVYCKSVYNDEDSMRSEILSTPVRVWERPTVSDTPPSDADVSWYNEEKYYVGAAGHPIKLMADGETATTGQGETIDKFLWDFDNDGEFGENNEIQNANQVISYTWDESNLDGRIKCIAVTNYDIQSEEKEFKLKVYPQLEVDSGGPTYNGRPKTQVRMDGEINNRDSYQGATFSHQWRLNSTTPDWELLCKNAAKDEGDYIELTPNESSKNGQTEADGLLDKDKDNWGVTGEFWTGGGTGADAFYIYAWATSTPGNERSANGNYSIAFDEYQDEIQLIYDGNLLEAITESGIDNGMWRSFLVKFDKGNIKIYLDHSLKLEYDDGAYQNRMANNLFGFGARTGGKTNYHRIRKMKWTTGELVDTDSNGIGEYTWIEDGTYQVMLTATATTSEGLVLENSETADVIIEAGKPTAMPGGPYRAGIYGGDFSPVQLEGNSLDFVEDEDIGYIDDWEWLLGDSRSNEFGLIGKVYEYPSDDPEVDTGNLDSIERYVDDKKVTPTAVKTFETVDFPEDSTGEFKHRKGEGTGLQDYFFARFTGFIDIQQPGDYQFHVSSDDGFRLKIDGKTVAEYPATRGARETSGTYTFASVDSYPIELTFFEKEMGTSLALSWTPPGGQKEIIPSDRLTSGGVAGGIWNPTHDYKKAGEYTVTLRVRSEYGKWSNEKNTKVKVIDGKIAGYVRAADLRTPVKNVKLTIKSSHVDLEVLKTIEGLYTTDDGIYTYTSDDGSYTLEHLPLGTYRVYAYKKNGDVHEFETNPRIIELTLNSPNQLAVDFVDLSVFPISGRIVYSIKKQDTDVLVKGVVVKAQAIGNANTIESLLSSASGNENYNLPLFSGKYLFKTEREGHDIRINENTPDYDSDTGLVTIDRSRTDIDFIDYTERELTVYTEDSGGHAILQYPPHFSNAGTPIEVEITGDNGYAKGTVEQTKEDDEVKTEFVATLPPGVYTVKITGASPEEQEVDVTGNDNSTTMTIPVKIELTVGPAPKLFDVDADFLSQFDMAEEDNPEGYMYYFPSELRTHVYTIRATANGNPVENFTLSVKDEISMLTEDAPDEQSFTVSYSEDDDEEDKGKYDYTIVGGLPKQGEKDPDTGAPLAGPKKISFKAEAEGYAESDTIEEQVVVLGDVDVGSAQRVVSIPTVNYMVLHDPPGDGSYSYLDDSMVIKGIISSMTITVDDEEIPVYPSPWSDERNIRNVDDDWPSDLKDDGLLDTRKYGAADPDKQRGTAADHYTWMAAIELGTGGAAVALNWLTGPLAYAFQLVKSAAKYGAMEGATRTGIGLMQYEVSPNRYLETPSGDEMPDLLGPGKGDVYFGEGWTLGLQTKYRMGIKCNREKKEDPCEAGWTLYTEEIETYKIIDRTNQYIYTIRDIENIISDLEKAIEGATDDKEEKKLKDAKSTWEGLLEKNLAYVWDRYYVVTEDKIEELEEKKESEGLTSAEEDELNKLKNVQTSIDDAGGDAFAAFGDADGKDLSKNKFETLIFSAGPTFEYSRTISEGATVSVSTGVGVESGSEIGSELEAEFGFNMWGTGTTTDYTVGSAASVSSATEFGAEWESGQEVEQSVGFALNDDDIGDNIATRVYADPVWGTPIFFQEPGSYTSDPWEPGTNKNVDVTMELLEVPSNRFDYHDGAHSKVKLTYTGQRELEASGIDFLFYSTEDLTVRFNGNEGPYLAELSKEDSAMTIIVSVYPPEMDMDNSEEQQYGVALAVEEAEDSQIGRELSFNVSFADMRSPRAIVMAPYDGERISPVFFPEDEPFEVEVVSEDTDLSKIQIQIRSKQTDGVWEPWRNIPGMVWEYGGDNAKVEVFDRLDREPARREFTFKWMEEEIKNLGVGEYALRAVATDKATRSNDPNFEGNVDIDPPSVVFLVDDEKPTVLTSIPDYQERESKRIYRGELSVIFTDDMRSTDFSDRTFYVTDLLAGGQKVAGFVSYSPALRKVIFVPKQPFKPNGFYRAEVKTDNEDKGERGVHDLAGNPLDNVFMWTFRTTDAPFEPTWSITLRAADGTDTDANNIAAVKYGAEYGEDERDARAVPALGERLRVNFLNRGIVGANEEPVELDRDIRPADGRLEHHWFFVVDYAAKDSTVTIYYKPSLKLTQSTTHYPDLWLVEFDKDGNVANRIQLDASQVTVDENTGEPLEDIAYEYTNSETRTDSDKTYNFDTTSRYFRLDVQKASLVATELKVGSSGWTFLSVPIRPESSDPFVNLGDDIDPFQLYRYDTQLNGYKIYPLDLGEVALQTGHGYFTRLNNNLEIDVGGASNQNDVELQLDAAGWHAIGNPFIKAVDVANLKLNGQAFDDAVAAGLAEGTLYRWKTGDSDAYEEMTSASQMESWDGCWLKTKKEGVTLIIPVPEGTQNALSPLPGSFDPPMAPEGERQWSTQASPSASRVTPAEGGRIFAEGQFDLKVILTSDVSSDLTTTLGTRQNAKVKRDNLDQSEPPRLSQTVSVYFDHSDWNDQPGSYNRDYQPIMEVGEQRTWQLTAFTDKSHAKMTLSWADAIRGMPDDTMFYFRQVGESEWQDMRQVQSVDIASDLRITKVPFEVRAERFAMSPLSDLEVIAGEKQVTLRWEAVENGFIEGYTITRRVVSGDGSPDEKRYMLQPDANQFIDTDVTEEATYTYQVTVRFKSGAFLNTDRFTVTVRPVIKETVLLQSYPNPFNPDTWIPYELTEETPVTIEIYNVAGQLVHSINIGTQPRGRYISKEKAAHWDGRTGLGERASNGVYFYVLKAGDFSAARKMVILK